MNLVEFEAALGAYGANFSRWPARLAQEAQAFVADDEAGSRELQHAAALDALLTEAVKPAPVDAATMGRILAGISAHPARERAVRPTGRLFAWAGVAMAVFLVAGFVLGLALPATSDDDALAALMFGVDSGSTLDVGEIL